MTFGCNAAVSKHVKKSALVCWCIAINASCRTSVAGCNSEIVTGARVRRACPPSIPSRDRSSTRTCHIPKALALYRHFADRVQCGFGIGTNLTNDLGITPINVVMKLVECNGQPVAKLSDSSGKTLSTDETFLAYCGRVSGRGV